MNCYKYLWLGLLIGSYVCDRVEAQVTIDGTTNTNLTTTDNGIRIENGDRAGANLFHSFSEFSIPDGSSATFNNAVEIENIFSRVTGGDISDINGAINANGGANLLLINPAGIVFGENASLNIGGSFFATSADSLLFESGEFSAVNPQAAPILTINRPIGLNFGDNPGDLVNRSNFGLQTTSVDIGLIPEFEVRNSIGLQVDNGETISLIGGNVVLENAGGITASGGTVELGGLNNTGTITLNSDGGLVFPEEVERGNVTLTEQSRVNVTSDNGGTIEVNAKNLEITQQSELYAGIAENSNSPTNTAGDININATDSVSIIGELDVSTFANFEELIQAFTFTRDYGAGIRNNVGLSSVRRGNDRPRSNAIGNGGAIDITTGTLEMSNAAVIDTSIFGTGDGGDLNINADSITLTGSQSVFLSQVRGFNFGRVREQGIGDGGNLNINTGSISLSEGAGILLDVQPGALGNGGDININADGTASFVYEENPGFILTQLGQESVGSAGDINIKAGSLKIGNAQFISDASTNSEGNAGNIIFQVRDNLVLDNGTLVLTQIQSGATGDGGFIDINTGSISLSGGAKILSDVQPGAVGNGGDININAKDVANFVNEENSGFISTQLGTESVGSAGDINIKAGSINIGNTQFISDASTNSEGNAGNIIFQARDNLVLDNKTLVLTQIQSGATGDGGFIDLDAGSISLDNLSLVSSNAATDSVGKAGDINITSSRLEVKGGSAIDLLTENDFAGGDLSIEANSLDLIDGGKLVASGDGIGNAGNINLTIAGDITIDNRNPPTESLFTEVILQDLNDEAGIFANTIGDSSGAGGNIAIAANSVFLNNGGSISAATVSNAGGNVSLQLQDLLSLRNNSSISARSEGFGSGGNIAIDTNFIFASPNQNNDIIANAQQGSGGNIDITAESIVGIQERSSNPPNNTNDLDVSSELSIDGTVTINNPDVDPTSGIIELPTVPIDAESILAQDLCKVENEDIAGGSSFIVTGRGGLTPTSAESLDNRDRVVNWADETVEVSQGVVSVPQAKQSQARTVIQSQGLAIAPDGNIWLTANNINFTPQNSNNHPDCQT